MIVAMIIIIVILIYLCNLLYNIRENISRNTHNTAKICDHLQEIKNKIGETIKNNE